MIIARELDSAGYGFRGETLEKLSSTTSSEALENERIFQRRAAICAVFSLFVTIFILCMLAIYGGINPRGLVLRETFRVANSTKPKLKPSTTIAPPNGTNNMTGYNSSTTATPIKVVTPPVVLIINMQLDNSTKIATNNTVIDTPNIDNTSLDGLKNDSFYPKENDELSILPSNNSLSPTISSFNNNAPPRNISYGEIGNSTHLQDKDGDFAEVEIKVRPFTTAAPISSKDFEGLSVKPDWVSKNVESSTFIPSSISRSQTEFSNSFTSISTGFVRHSRRKMKRLYGFLMHESLTPLRRNS